MKKITTVIATILLLVGISSPVAAQGYYYYPEKAVNVRIGATAGYNFAETVPNTAAFVSVSGAFWMAEVEAGWSQMNEPGKNFFYASPSIGFITDDYCRFYALIGLTNWGSYDETGENFKTNEIYCKVKFGVDIAISRNAFITLNWNYVMNDNQNPDRKHRPEKPTCKNNGINLGLGVRF